MSRATNRAAIWNTLQIEMAGRGAPSATPQTRLSDLGLNARELVTALAARLDEVLPELDAGRVVHYLDQVDHLDGRTLDDVADWLTDFVTPVVIEVGRGDSAGRMLVDIEEGLGAEESLPQSSPADGAPMPAAPPPASRDAFKSAKPPADEPFVRTRIHFATDRKSHPDNTTGVGFGAERGDKLILGECEVSFPLDRRPGELPRPKIWKLEFKPDPKKHVMLHKVVTQAEQAFYDGIKAKLDQTEDRQAFVFIHGYNVSFESAALRTAQLALDLKFDGAPVLYSWPSNGRVAAYAVDHNNAAASAERLGGFLETLAARTGAKRVHIIAHSMGNQTLCAALDRLSLTLGGKKVVHHVALAAPDVDAERFRQMSQGVCKAAATVTLYASARDLAIRASKRFNGDKRAGEPLVIVSGVDTVDASAVDTDFLSHGYFSDDRAMLEDIYNLIRGVPAADRFSLKPGKTPAGGGYYVFR
jgi:esterase/lipase superfamily enzyme